MKKFFSRPAVALILTVVLCFCSVLLNTKLRFGSLCEIASSRFYGYETEDGVGVSDHLQTLLSASDSLAVLGTVYDVKSAEAVTESASVLRALLAERSMQAGTICSAYEELLGDLFSVESSLARLSLSEEDAEAFTAAQHTASEAKVLIDSSDYNRTVERFLTRFHGFPTPLLAKLAGVRMPELFVS